MLIPATVDAIEQHQEWQQFVLSAFITGFAGGLLVFSNKVKIAKITSRQAFILTPLSWVVLSLFAALPIWLSKDLHLNFIQSMFEATSGITTTGATLITGLDNLPSGILLWRILLQYLGGIGIVASATLILPLLGIGGMQLFKTEASEASEKFLPRATAVAKVIVSIYIILTCLCAILLYSAGMSAFDAITHAMTTVATAGFSNHDASIAYFDSQTIETIIICFMILGSLPFVLYYKLALGKGWNFLQNSQVRVFLILTVLLVVANMLWLKHQNGLMAEDAMRLAAFNTVSIITTTGYTTADYGLWGSFPMVLFFILFCVGGCTGSTSGGMKIFRFQIMFKTALAQINKLINPHGVFKVHYNGKVVDDSIVTSVLCYLMLFAFTFVVSVIALSATGQDFITAISTGLATLGNIGPALGQYAGPVGNYSQFGNTELLIYCINMLLGRLELFILFVLCAPNFWRN